MNGVKACALRSGSSGNLFYFACGGTHLITDCGVNGKSFAGALREVDFPEDRIASMQGILITHEHRDHIAGLGVVMRRYHLPVYMTRRTFEAALPSLGKIDLNLVRFIYPGEDFAIGDFGIRAFRTSHDAAEPVGYTFDTGHGKFALCTDLGVMEPHILEELKGSRLVFIESNYEPGLLEAGPYPRPLKERVKGPKGHLSNQACAGACCELLDSGTTHFMLAHLSRENNYPDMAKLVMRQTLGEHGASEEDYVLEACGRFRSTAPCIWE